MITRLTQILKDAGLEWPEYRCLFDIFSITSPKADIFLNFSLPGSCFSQRLDVRLASCGRQPHFEKVI